MRRAIAPGRVNLIGDHTDYTGGLCLPMALAQAVVVEVELGGDRIRLHSQDQGSSCDLALRPEDPASVEPGWARYVAAVAAEVRPEVGITGTVSSTVPTGAGLSSSAALEIASALALGYEGDRLALAELGQRAELAASGVPCGILDQLASVGGVDGHALVMDCRTRHLDPVPVPEGVEFVVVHSGQERTLAGSAYGTRRAECEAAEAQIGALRDATLDDVATLADPALRARARHVVSENARVRAAADALATGDVVGLGALFDESHASLRDDFDNSTPIVDATVERLRSQPGVHGVRMTGGGWGGCVVAVADPGAVDVSSLDRAWVVEPGPGASVTSH